MNIYQIETGGETDWVCANTAIEALQYYQHITDINVMEFDNTDDITLIPKEEWPNRYILDTDNPGEDGEYPVLCTFEQFMEGQITPEIIATTCI